MKLYQHKNRKEYIKAQIKKNEKKIEHVWVKNNEIILISKKVKQYIPEPKFGICHGVRNAWEVKKLRNLLNIEIIGTDIAPSATRFPNTIQWDFHKIKEEWKNSVDFIYSNSFDHSYDPSLCLDIWMKCIKKGVGVCFIHWMSTNANKIDAADCFAGTIKDYRQLIGEKYNIIEEIGRAGRKVFIIKHKSKE